MHQHGVAETIQAALMAWFRRHQRNLPWRSTRNPYAIWVSEIMLQQTQVATVKPYFQRFMRQFPNVRALAKAPLEAVLKAWEGMGYYARARNLHRAAKQVVSNGGGKLPKTPEELRKLPGVGQYTAGAIASIAFGLDEPVLDGNVMRVLCRAFRIRKNPRASKAQRRLWSLARRLIPSGRAALFNQALMDLGATLCTPKAPRCPVCPIRTVCLARAHNEQEELPARVRRRPLPHFDIAAGVIWRGKRVLIDQRRPEGLLGGLWEFPGGKRRPRESLKACLVREVREELGVEVEVLRPLITVKHAYSHFRITLHVFECRYVSGKPRPSGGVRWKWVALGELDNYPFPSAQRKIIAAHKESLRDASLGATRSHEARGKHGPQELQQGGH
jgi:A/G-specific adenine glycosylase